MEHSQDYTRYLFECTYLYKRRIKKTKWITLASVIFPVGAHSSSPVETVKLSSSFILCTASCIAVWFSMPTMATDKFTFNPYTIAMPIEPRIASMYRAGTTPGKIHILVVFHFTYYVFKKTAINYIDYIPF